MVFLSERKGQYLKRFAPLLALSLSLTFVFGCGQEYAAHLKNLSNPLYKFHPGHYISVTPDAQSQADILDAIGTPLQRPGVVGVQKRYRWIDLEVAQGVYDFSELRSDLDLLAKQKKYLVAMIVDKSFTNDNPMPAYLQSSFTLPLSPTSKAGQGFIAKRWDPYVVSRFKTLLQKLGEEFDQHPALEGIATQETALGLDAATRAANGYTPEKYRDALIDILKSASQSFTFSRVFWYMNFLESGNKYIPLIAAAVAPSGVMMGGPDVLMEDVGLNAITYPFYEQFKNKMILFCSMQNDSFDELKAGSTTEYWPMNDMFIFARDTLHVKYLFWNRKRFVQTAIGSSTWLDALPIIAGNPTINL